jgi:DNA-binding transcriptional MerR regulator
LTESALEAVADVVLKRELALMKIGELARRSGVSAHTLRYYERIGLLPYADRDRSGLRSFDPSILAWIAFLGRLKTTGMPIRTMLAYARLRAEGDQTNVLRRELLESHRARVRAHVAELHACLLVLDTKIAGYSDAEPRTMDHDTSSINPLKPLRAGPTRAGGY